MKYEDGSPVPNITHSSHPYMVDLYNRLGAEAGDDPQQVLDRAEAAWNAAEGIGERVEAAEALIGRILDGQEISALPPELRSAIFDGEPFEVAVNGVARALQNPES